MAWKRGNQNNQAGLIRKGHIKEFLRPTSKEINVHARLKILNLEDMPEFSHRLDGIALVCTKSNGLPECFVNFISENSLYIHAHEHPRSVLLVVLNESIPPGCVALNATQRLNNKVCTGELEDWTIYSGEEFTYDAREGVIGDTQIRKTGTFAPILLHVIMEIRPRFIPDIKNGEKSVQVDASQVSSQLACNLYGCIISLGELYTVINNGCEYVCRVTEVRPETQESEGEVDEEEDDKSFEIDDHYRGIVEAHTTMYLTLDCAPEYCQLINPLPLPTQAPQLDNVVQIQTSDDEIFPVKRRLLTPCLALTSVVQAGRGKYKGDREAPLPASTTVTPEDNKNNAITTRTATATSPTSQGGPSTSTKEVEQEQQGQEQVVVPISLDACTFDRVLLYLEHEARGEEFRFDPLIASELLVAAITLKLDGLQRCCERVLGSFQERVRRTPIRFEEVKRRNDAGTAAAAITGKRSETLLIMSGMVLDITRWIDEHPGGSTIIPNQALNIDCTVFFEIYHASRQSFLYLKEFYIGELAVEDIPNVPKAQALSITANSSTTVDGDNSVSTSTSSDDPSNAFMDQLKRVTGWRLKPEDIVSFEVHKSF